MSERARRSWLAELLKLFKKPGPVAAMAWAGAGGAPERSAYGLGELGSNPDASTRFLNDLNDGNKRNF